MPIMKKAEQEKAAQIVRDLLAKYDSIRDFAIAIGIDPADVHRWKTGSVKVRVTGVVALAKHFDIEPHMLRPDWFPKNLQFVFKKTKG